MTQTKPKVARRKPTKLTKAQIKKYATQMIAELLSGFSASTLVEGFNIRVFRDRKRGATEGERMEFCSEISKVVESLQKRAK